MQAMDSGNAVGWGLVATKRLVEGLGAGSPSHRIQLAATEEKTAAGELEEAGDVVGSRRQALGSQ